MKLLNIGFGNMVSAERLIAVVSPDSAPIKRLIQESRERGMLLSDEPMGRKMDFLIQEVNRESNTIGSKCNDITIARDVVALKAEVEKIREQVQNIE